jgi:hypothetical protein
VGCWVLGLVAVSYIPFLRGECSQARRERVELERLNGQG